MKPSVEPACMYVCPVLCAVVDWKYEVYSWELFERGSVSEVGSVIVEMNWTKQSFCDTNNFFFA